MVGVLPYLEQQTLYDQVGQEQPLSFPANTAASKTRLSVFLCPSDGMNGRGLLDNRADLDDERAVTNYKACAGSNWAWGDYQNSATTGKWPGETNGYEKGNGIICRNQDSLRTNFVGMAAVTDGTSNTFAVGESVPAWSKWCWWYWFNGSTGTCSIPLNYRKKLGAGQMALQFADWNNNSGFMSQHSGGAQFAFVDGHVQFVADSIHLEAYRALATVSGSETLPND